MDRPVVLKTKYAYHALLWLLKPDVVLDVGSMDGSDSKRFRNLLPDAEIVAFEGNPYNYRAMRDDPEIAGRRIRVVNNLVSDSPGPRSFFVQRPLPDAGAFNRGVSSLTRREQDGASVEEVRLDAVRIDGFLAREYPDATGVALWIDVEGHAYSVLEGIGGAARRVRLVHVEVETSEIWPGQKLEPEVLRLAALNGLVPVARSNGVMQRDFVLVSRDWYEARRVAIHALLRLCTWSGPAVSRVLGWVSGARSILR